jgi:hypothetical protein
MPSEAIARLPSSFVRDSRRSLLVLRCACPVRRDLTGLFLRWLDVPECEQQRQVVNNLQAAAEDQRQPGKRKRQQHTGKDRTDRGRQAARHCRDAGGRGPLSGCYHRSVLPTSQEQDQAHDVFALLCPVGVDGYRCRLLVVVQHDISGRCAALILGPAVAEAVFDFVKDLASARSPSSAVGKP